MSREPSPRRPPAPPELSDALASALRTGLRPRPAGGEPTPLDREVRLALRAVCDDARRRALRAEEVIVALKEAWAAIPEVRSLPPGPERQAMLAHFVTLCIDEYYAPRGD